MYLDGPKMPIITGPKVAKIGDNVTLSCNASSNPLSIYKWFFNDSVVANMSEYVTPPLIRDMSGMYTCVAYNNITGKNSTAYTMLILIGETWMAILDFLLRSFSYKQIKKESRENDITVLDFCFVFRSDNRCTCTYPNGSCHRRSFLLSSM